MKNYIAYDNRNGKILFTGQVPDGESVVFAEPWVASIEGTIDIPDDGSEYFVFDGVPTCVPPTLEVLKERKKREVCEGWQKAFISGKFRTSLGFVVQHRRTGYVNDMQNVAELWQTMVDNNETTVDFRDANNATHPITRAQLLGILREMRSILRGRNTKKWKLQELIDQATSETDLENIKW